MTMLSATLTDRTVLAVSGEDAVTFLQGLVSNDMRNITPERPIFAALLSPQGKFLFDFFLLLHEDHFWLETNKARAPELKKRLEMYKLRANVTISEMPQMHVVAGWSASGKPEGALHVYQDPRLADMGWRAIGEQIAGERNERKYHHYRLELAVPEGSLDMVVDRSLLLEMGYDILNGVDFNKGCYVGQEVTARSKHRAQLRKMIHQVRANEPLPVTGAMVIAGNRDIGELRSRQGHVGIALLNIEDVKHAQEEQLPILCGGIELTASLPAWIR